MKMLWMLSHEDALDVECNMLSATSAPCTATSTRWECKGSVGQGLLLSTPVLSFYQCIAGVLAPFGYLGIHSHQITIGT